MMENLMGQLMLILKEDYAEYLKKGKEHWNNCVQGIILKRTKGINALVQQLFLINVQQLNTLYQAIPDGI